MKKAEAIKRFKQEYLYTPSALELREYMDSLEQVAHRNKNLRQNYAHNMICDVRFYKEER